MMIPVLYKEILIRNGQLNMVSLLIFLIWLQKTFNFNLNIEFKKKDFSKNVFQCLLIDRNADFKFIYIIF